MHADDIRSTVRQEVRRHRPVKKTFVAAEAIPAFSAVYLNGSGELQKFDSTNLFLNRKCLGITSKDVIAGGKVCVVMFGEIKILPANLTVSEVYYAVEDGQLSTAFPIPGLTAKVGVALSECILFVDIDHEEPQGLIFNIEVHDYTVAGAFDGVNQDFQTTAQFTPGTLSVYLSGVRLHLDDDYVITGPDTFQLTFVPNIANKIFAKYIPV